jgi:O-antigen ligase
VVAVVLAAAYSLRQPRRMAGFVAPVLVGMLVSGLFVYPRLVAYTGGVLETRFTDFTLEERSSLLEADLTAFRSNPVFGVGPGVGKQYRHLADGRGISAHTEFTRLLAEHGCAGVVAIGLLLAMVVASYRRAATRGNRMWVLLMAGWAVSEMTHGAMRFAAISFVFGLMTVTLVDDQAGVSA